MFNVPYFLIIVSLILLKMFIPAISFLLNSAYTDNAERAQDIDIAKAEAAHHRADELMKQIKNVQDVDYARLQAVIEKETNRIRIGRKFKKLPNTELASRTKSNGEVQVEPEDEKR